MRKHHPPPVRAAYSHGHNSEIDLRYYNPDDKKQLSREAPLEATTAPRIGGSSKAGLQHPPWGMASALPSNGHTPPSAPIRAIRGYKILPTTTPRPDHCRVVSCIPYGFASIRSRVALDLHSPTRLP